MIPPPVLRCKNVKYLFEFEPFHARQSSSFFRDWALCEDLWHEEGINDAK